MTDLARTEPIVFVGEAANGARDLARALERLGYATAEAPSIGQIGQASTPAAVVVPAGDGVDAFRSVRALRMYQHLGDPLVFVWTPGRFEDPVGIAVAVAVAAGADDVVAGGWTLDEAVDRVAGRLRERRMAREREMVSARRIRDANELLARERDARRALDAEKEVRERLLAMMARELVTHANVAIGWLGLMRRERLDTARRDAACAKVESALRAQLSLLDELVGMNPMMAGHLNLDCRRIDMAAIVRVVAADVGDERARVVATSPAFVVADVEHVIRAIRSLIDATTHAAYSVTLQVSVSGDFVRVRFSDAVRDDDESLAVARRVAALYGGAIVVGDGETVFALPAGA